MTTPSLRVYPLLYLPRCPTWTCAISNPYMDHIWVTPIPKIGLWTLRPRFSSGLSPRSLFHTRQRFPLSNHVTSGCLSPRSLFPLGQRFPKSRDFRLYEPAIPFFNWSAVSHPTSGHDVTRPIRSQNHGHLGPLYYCRATS